MTDWTSHRTPEPPHPFAHAVSNGEWVLVSGVGGHHPDGGIDEDAATQTQTALATISAVLRQAGSSLEEIVYFRPYVTELGFAEEMDAVLRDVLPEPRPAGGALTVVGLADPRMKVEFEAWAHRGARLRDA